MRLISALAALIVIAPTLAGARGDIPGLPKVFGARGIPELRRKSLFGTLGSQGPELRARANGVTNTCGPDVGSCDPGYCCSPAGYCGTTEDYCAAPDCQFNYGPACDANQVPPGTNTSTVTRDQPGSVPYGGDGIYHCTKAGTVALTFDDGPYIYTSHILDILQSYNAKATFFITSNNNGKGEIDNAANPWADVITRMYNEGHQIASHTWSHQDLSLITPEQRRDQMYKSEMSLRNILGVFPTYMRPPYSSCTAASGCEDDLGSLGYHITYFDLDTDDYEQDDPSKIQNSKDWFSGNLSSVTSSTGSKLTIAHDIHNQTAYNLTSYMLDVLQASGFTAVTVGDCLSDDPANWYRSSSGSEFTSSATTATATATSTSSTPAVSPTKVSTDGSCGGGTGEFCTGSGYGDCCSQYGFCGNDTGVDGHCGTGCQPEFGICPGSSSSVTTTTASSTSVSLTSSAPTSTASLPISDDATCGVDAGKTCLGSAFGNCCSDSNFCGTGDEYCGDGCQSEFGTCGNATSSTSSASSSRTTTSRFTTTASSTTSTSVAPSSISTSSTHSRRSRSSSMAPTESCYSYPSYETPYPNPAYEEPAESGYDTSGW